MIVLVPIVFIATICLLSYLWDALNWNGGECDCCLSKYEYFATDSQGNRGYHCRCSYDQYIWIGWNVDAK